MVSDVVSVSPVPPIDASEVQVALVPAYQRYWYGEGPVVGAMMVRLSEQ